MHQAAEQNISVAMPIFSNDVTTADAELYIDLTLDISITNYIDGSKNMPA